MDAEDAGEKDGDGAKVLGEGNRFSAIDGTDGVKDGGRGEEGVA